VRELDDLVWCSDSRIMMSHHNPVKPSLEEWRDFERLSQTRRAHWALGNRVGLRTWTIHRPSAPSSLPSCRSKVPSGQCPAFRATSSTMQSENPTLERLRKLSSAACTTSGSCSLGDSLWLQEEPACALHAMRTVLDRINVAESAEQEQIVRKLEEEPMALMSQVICKMHNCRLCLQQI